MTPSALGSLMSGPRYRNWNTRTFTCVYKGWSLRWQADVWAPVAVEPSGGRWWICNGDHPDVGVWLTALERDQVEKDLEPA